MELVRCISERKSNKGQVIVGKKYWIDLASKYTDSDGDEYVNVYLDEAGENHVGIMMYNHFTIIYRYLNFGGSLSSYVNTKTGFLLKDIIGWCLNNQNHSLAMNIIMYIHDNKLNIPENMEKEYIVNHIPFRDFAERGMAEEYEKYMGYSMYCID